MLLQSNSRLCRSFILNPEKLMSTSVPDLFIVAQNLYGLAPGSFYITFNGKIVQSSDTLKPAGFYHVVPRVLGGKGGFGSMLRAIGAQIEKTTSREACRDLSGRRMRDINNEKKLKEWIGKKAEREREKEEKRQARIDRRHREPHHKFDDPEYDRQKAQVKESLENALETGLRKSESADRNRKRKSDDEIERGRDLKKKAAEWLGVSVDNISDLDTSSSDESENDVTSTCSASSSSEATSALNSDIKEFGTKKKSVLEPSPLASSSGYIPTDTSTTNKCVNAEVFPSSCDQHEVPPRKTMEEETLIEQENILNPCSASATEEVAEEPCKSTKESVVPLDLSNYATADELESCGLDNLKEALMVRGLKCGGTLKERALRLFSVKGLMQEEFPAALKAKPRKTKQSAK